MESILNSMTVFGTEASKPDGASLDPVTLPPDPPDPSAVAEFSDLMQKGAGPAETSGIFEMTALEKSAVNSTVKEFPLPAPGAIDPASSISSPYNGEDIHAANLGDTLFSARRDKAQGVSEEWLGRITDIIGRDDLSHMDLYRVQVLAGIHHIEAARGSSVNQGIDDGLRTVLKNS
ncbi:MAG: hypothetical protein HQK66_10790 [Desulfamplus sp.]|nr:hypothetical protein [Desulfamplus sp.]